MYHKKDQTKYEQQKEYQQEESKVSNMNHNIENEIREGGGALLEGYHSETKNGDDDKVHHNNRDNQHERQQQQDNRHEEQHKVVNKLTSQVKEYSQEINLLQHQIDQFKKDQHMVKQLQEKAEIERIQNCKKIEELTNTHNNELEQVRNQFQQKLNEEREQLEQHLESVRLETMLEEVTTTDDDDTDIQKLLMLNTVTPTSSPTCTTMSYHTSKFSDDTNIYMINDIETTHQEEKQLLQKKIIELEYALQQSKKESQTKINEIKVEHTKEIDELLAQLDLVEAEHKDNLKEKDVQLQQRETIILNLGKKNADTKKTQIDEVYRRKKIEMEFHKVNQLYIQQKKEYQLSLEKINTLEEENQKLQLTVTSIKMNTIQEPTGVYTPTNLDMINDGNKQIKEMERQEENNRNSPRDSKNYGTIHLNHNTQAQQEVIKQYQRTINKLKQENEELKMVCEEAMAFAEEQRQ